MGGVTGDDAAVQVMVPEHGPGDRDFAGGRGNFVLGEGDAGVDQEAGDDLTSRIVQLGCAAQGLAVDGNVNSAGIHACGLEPDADGSVERLWIEILQQVPVGVRAWDAIAAVFPTRTTEALQDRRGQAAGPGTDVFDIGLAGQHAGREQAQHDAQREAPAFAAAWIRDHITQDVQQTIVAGQPDLLRRQPRGAILGKRR